MKRMFIRRTAVVEAMVLLLVIVLPILSEKAEAAGLQQVMVRLDRMTVSTATTGTVCMKTAVTNVTESNVVVTFPTGFTVNAASNWTVSTAADIVFGSSLWPGILTATNVTGQAVTFPSSDLTADTLYCFNWTSSAALTNNSTDGASQTGTIASGGNSSSYAVAVVTAGQDQIAVSASVPSTFTFALGATSTSLGILSTTTASATGVTVDIGTNAASGWVAWVKSANAALTSGSTLASVATAGTVNNNDTDLAVDVTSGYVLDVDITTDNATGTGTVTQGANYGQEYDGLNSTSGGTLSTSFQPIAASDGTTAGDRLTLIPRARITAVQAAASDYSDTLTVVGAGRF